MTKRELFDRLETAISAISINPKTLCEVNLLLEDFIVSIEEIANDLEIDSDDCVAKRLKEIIMPLRMEN